MTIRRSRVRLGRADIDAISADEVTAAIVASAKEGRGGLLVTPNVDHLRLLEVDQGLVDVYERADFIVPDGMPLLWLSRLQKTPLAERIAGSDLLFSLSAAAAAEKVQIYLCGGREGMAEAASIELNYRTKVKTAGLSAPPRVDINDPKQVAVLADDIKASGAKIAFLAFGAPKQELLAAKLAKLVPGVWFLGVGGSFEMAANYVNRAPKWVQRIGLEWLFRMLQEPKRLFKRYLAEDLPFLVRLTVRVIVARHRGEGLITIETGK